MGLDLSTLGITLDTSGVTRGAQAARPHVEGLGGAFDLTSRHSQRLERLLIGLAASTSGISPTFAHLAGIFAQLSGFGLKFGLVAGGIAAVVAAMKELNGPTREVERAADALTKRLKEQATAGHDGWANFNLMNQAIDQQRSKLAGLTAGWSDYQNRAKAGSTQPTLAKSSLLDRAGAEVGLFFKYLFDTNVAGRAGAMLKEQNILIERQAALWKLNREALQQHTKSVTDWAGVVGSVLQSGTATNEVWRLGGQLLAALAAEQKKYAVNSLEYLEVGLRVKALQDAITQEPKRQQSQVRDAELKAMMAQAKLSRDSSTAEIARQALLRNEIERTIEGMTRLSAADKERLRNALLAADVADRQLEKQEQLRAFNERAAAEQTRNDDAVYEARKALMHQEIELRSARGRNADELAAEAEQAEHLNRLMDIQRGFYGETAAKLIEIENRRHRNADAIREEARALEDFKNRAKDLIGGETPEEIAIKFKQVTRELGKALQQGLSQGLQDFFTAGTRDFQTFFAVLGRMGQDFAQRLQEWIDKAPAGVDTSLAKFGVKASKFAAGAGAGVAIGTATGSAGLGLLGGAATGAAIGGPFGALGGAIAGFVSGIIGHAAKVREEAERLRQAKEEWARIMDDFVQVWNPRGALGDSIEGLRRRIEDARKGAFQQFGFSSKAEADRQVERFSGSFFVPASVKGYRDALKALDDEFDRGKAALTARAENEKYSILQGLEVKRLQLAGQTDAAEQLELEIEQKNRRDAITEKLLGTDEGLNQVLLAQVAAVEAAEQADLKRTQTLRALDKQLAQAAADQSLAVRAAQVGVRRGAGDLSAGGRGNQTALIEAERQAALMDADRQRQLGQITEAYYQELVRVINMEFDASLEEIQKAVEKFNRETQQSMALSSAGLEVTISRLQGRATDDSRVRAAQRQYQNWLEIQDAVAHGADDATIAMIQYNQALRDQAEGLRAAHEAQVRQEDIQARILGARASISGSQADRVAYERYVRDREKEREVWDAIQQGASEADIAMLKLAQSMSDAAAAAAQVRQQTDFMTQLQIDYAKATGNTVEAERLQHDADRQRRIDQYKDTFRTDAVPQSVLDMIDRILAPAAQATARGGGAAGAGEAVRTVQGSITEFTAFQLIDIERQSLTILRLIEANTRTGGGVGGGTTLYMTNRFGRDTDFNEDDLNRLADLLVRKIDERLGRRSRGVDQRSGSVSVA